MKIRRGILAAAMILAAAGLFAQSVGNTALIRDYVGLISVADHPDIIAVVERIEKINGKNKTDESPAKQAPYERPEGSGVLVQWDNGTTYILTNCHVIASGWDFSLSFETTGGEKTVFTGLTLIAADEKQDLALLAFAEGNGPDREGLTFLERPVQEGDDVYTAGFPALGRDPIWQFGRGLVSNARVTYHSGPDDETTEGPFIQHTGQADPGNSGGPLLAADPDTFSGFAVAGINSRSARNRQAANYSIPVDTIRKFMEAALNPVYNTEAEREKFDERLAEFVKDFNGKERSVLYSAYNQWFSYSSLVNNAEYAYFNVMASTSSDAKERVNSYFNMDPVWALRIARDWTALETLLSEELKAGEVGVVSVESGTNEAEYTVVLRFKKKEIASRWVLEYGIWRMAEFGSLNGDKTKIAQLEKRYNALRKIRDGHGKNHGWFVEGGYTYIASRGHAVYGALGRHFIGLRVFYADKDYSQVELYVPLYFTPLQFGAFSMGFNMSPGFGVKIVPKVDGKDWGLRLGLSPQIGFQITSSLVPGLYLGAAYQFNWYFRDSADQGKSRHLFILFAGYRFKGNFSMLD
jgi:serine protease Do